MTPAEFATYVRYKTRTDAVTFTDAEIMALANPFIDEFSQEIIKANEDLFVLEFLRNLEAGKRKYALPDQLLSQMKYLEANLKVNSTDDDNWQRLNETDMNWKRIPTNEANIISHYSGKLPEFFRYANVIMILSGSTIIDVTDGIVLHCIVWPAHLTALTGTTDMSVDPSSVTKGFPRQFHRLLGTRVVIEYKQSQEKPIPLVGNELTFEKDFEKAIESIRGGNLDLDFQASVPQDTGQDY